MTTKKDKLFLNQPIDKKLFDTNTNDGFLYSNLNLNKVNQPLIELNPVQPYSKASSNKDRECFVDSKETQNCFHSWEKCLDSTCLKALNDLGGCHRKEDEEANKRWKKVSSNVTNSTLSLHITAYENSVEASVDSSNENIGVETKKNNEKTGFIKKWKNSKESTFTSVIQTQFEFPRQQKESSSSTPEVMQFKASQKLLNPTEGNSDAITRADDKKAPPPYNAANVVKKLTQHFPLRNASSHFSSFEQELVLRIKDLLLSPEKVFEDLCFEISGYDEPQEDTDEESEESCHGTDEESEDPSYELENNLEELQLLEEKYSEEKWREIIANNRAWQWSHVQHEYRKIKNRNEITRMERYLNKGGSRITKLRQLDEMVLYEFTEWKQQLQIVHDRDLRDAALAAADGLELTAFDASEFFIRKFKKRHRIVSRKITNFVTTRDLVFEEDLNAEIEKFREAFLRLTSNTPLTEIFNSDQTGLQLEMISKRTLTEEGAKKVLAIAQKANALTHSFTVQPVISAAGKLLFPVFVTFHEPNVPRCFEEQLEPFRYIKAMSSSSGKMSSFLAKKWFNDVFKKQVPQGSHLVVDSWTGYNQAFQTETNIKIHTLPKKSTGELQPLDVFFNRQFKALYRVISDKIRRRHNSDFNISDRRGIATILQLTLCQMASKEFENMLRYAWYKSGLTNALPPPFLTPVQYCFDLLTPNSYCSISECKDRAFIACSNCENYICFNHFVISLHDCVDFLKNE